MKNNELNQISFYLAKDGETFDTVINKERLRGESDKFKIREFQVESREIKFFCFLSDTSKSDNPNWLDFINEELTENEQLNFRTTSIRPNGLLLIDSKSKILAATFGASGASLLNKSVFTTDFGIITAMNMCGNNEVRQAKSRTHALTTQNIARN